MQCSSPRPQLRDICKQSYALAIRLTLAGLHCAAETPGLMDAEERVLRRTGSVRNVVTLCGMAHGCNHSSTSYLVPDAVVEPANLLVTTVSAVSSLEGCCRRYNISKFSRFHFSLARFRSAHTRSFQLGTGQ